MTRIRMLNGALYTLAVVGALAFGTVQAFASSGPRESERSYCPEEICDRACGGPGSWFCEPSGTCICI
jgi:hypothetical protein